MTNWQEIVDNITAPKDMSPSEWMEGELPKADQKLVAVKKTNLESFLETFIAKYQIAKLGSSQVALTLPAGISRIEFLKEAQTLSTALHTSKPDQYSAAQAVLPEILTIWESKRGFFETIKTEVSIKVDGRVQDSTKKTRREQEKLGLNDVVLQDMAVAHTAFYLLTGEDLFKGNMTRTAGDSPYFWKMMRPAGDTLFFFYSGLQVVSDYCYDGRRQSDIWASHYL